MDEVSKPLCHLVKGLGRTKACLTVWKIGNDILTCVYNENIHLGAVALSQFDDKSQRVSTSTITVLGHKDDVVAQRASYVVCKSTKRTVCAIAGIHIDNITEKEIAKILLNVDELVEEFKKAEDKIGNVIVEF